MTPEMHQSLKDSSLFHEFTEDELGAFVELLDPAEFAVGECIVRQEDFGDCMYLLVKGRVRVVHHASSGRDVELSVLKAGDFFGELALVDHGPRSADVVALDPAQLLRISQAAISALAGIYPNAAFKFLIAIGKLMVERLRTSNQRYVDSLLFSLGGKD
jgi:CRP-like cAMP-binding protein